MRICAGMAAALAAATLLVRPARAEDGELPVMRHDRAVQCYRDADRHVWRVQCDDDTRVCLYAPDSELSERGAWLRPLERARACQHDIHQPFDLAAFEGKGLRMVRAIPDAPPGWKRDERGRVFQIDFDLKRRLYLGGSWSPVTDAVGRSSIDFGLLVFEHWGGDGNPTRHRVRLVEGQAHLAPFSGELILAHYDVSRRFANPLLRVTTFFGTPRRSDLKMNLGFWAEGGHLEMHDTAAGDRSLWRFATAHATIDLWQSRDLASFARVRGGVGFEGTYHGDSDLQRTAVAPGGAVEADVVLDDAGFHHLAAELAYEVPVFEGGRAERIRARAQYEVIFIALNDQPLSLRVGAGAERRNDLDGIPDTWAFRADAGLRFSLWAPPRAR